MYTYYILMIIMFIILLIFVVKFICDRKKYKRAKETFKEIVGEVVGNREEYHKGTYYYTIVRYEIGKIDYYYEYYNPYKAKLGTKINLLYNPSNPHDVMKKDNKSSNNYVYYVLFGIALIYIIITFTMCFVMNRND